MSIEPQSNSFGGGEQPQPFADTPQDPPGGCSRPLLVGCGLAVVLVGLVLLVLLWKAQDIVPAAFEWALDQFEQQVEGMLPEDLSEAERQRLADAFDAAAAAVADGTADPEALQRLQGRLLEVARAGRLSRGEVMGLIEALEEVAGERAPPPAEEARPPGEEAPPAAEALPEPLAV